MSSKTYKDAVRQTWRHTEGSLAGKQALQRELVRYATLAPSSHNTQCWKFALDDRHISILPDLSRRCPAVDPDDHHLFVSLGCAAENLVQAGLAHGRTSAVHFDPAAGGAVRIILEPTKPLSSPLFQAIPHRQCSRAAYDGRPLSNEDLKQLEQAGCGQGVSVLLLTEKNQVETVLEYVVQGNTAQIQDPAFVEELKTWIRFSDDEAVRYGDGLFSRPMGNPAVPRWLGNRLFNVFLTPEKENGKCAMQIRSSAGIAVFLSDTDDKLHWVEAGRCYERFALQATALGIRNAFVNQPVEVAAARPQFASALGLGNRRPDLVVRFGHGPEMPRSLRRPIDSVIV
jgi:hypothetical protein